MIMMWVGFANPVEVVFNLVVLGYEKIPALIDGAKTVDEIYKRRQRSAAKRKAKKEKD